MDVTVSRRKFFTLLAGMGAYFLGKAGTAHAQAGSLCSFSKFTGGGGFQPAPPHVLQTVSDIAAVLGMNVPIQTFWSYGVQNAAAHPAGNIGPANTIVYNPQFLNQLHAVHPAAPISVLANEVGHFTPQGGFAPHPWSRELSADFVSGFAMCSLGHSEPESQVALRTMFDLYGSHSHPDTPRRIDAMRQGYHHHSQGGGS